MSEVEVSSKWELEIRLRRPPRQGGGVEELKPERVQEGLMAMATPDGGFTARFTTEPHAGTVLELTLQPEGRMAEEGNVVAGRQG